MGSCAGFLGSRGESTSEAPNIEFERLSIEGTARGECLMLPYAELSFVLLSGFVVDFFKFAF